MAHNVTVGDAGVNAACDALAALLNTGYLRIYDDSGVQPADPDAAVGDAVLLAELRFGATAFGAAVAGVATANAITKDSSANASGDASWFRALKSDGTTGVLDGTVGVGATYDCNVPTVSVVEAAEFSVTAMTVTAPQTP